MLSANMIACRGKPQREGEVIHVIVDNLADLSALLRSSGARNEAFPVQRARINETKYGGGADPRGRIPVEARDI